MESKLREGLRSCKTDKQVLALLKKLKLTTLYHQRGAKNGCSYVEFGNAIEGVEESKCQNSICRIIGAENEYDKTLVINQNGNLYGVYFTKFDKVEKIEVVN